jgi:hypothetical protein
MMLRGKTSGVRFFITDRFSNETYVPNLRGIINVDQANRFGRDPEMIWQLARYLAKEHAARTGRTPRVQAFVLTSLNGRKPQLFIDPEVDLAAEPKYARNRPWVLPLKEPLRSSPWKIPLGEWEKHIEMPKLPVGFSQLHAGQCDSRSGELHQNHRSQSIEKVTLCFRKFSNESVP